VSSQSLTIAPKKVAGVCSPDTSWGAQLTVTVADDATAAGVFLLPKTEYDKLMAAASSPTPVKVEFTYYKPYSCVGGAVKTCAQDTANNMLQNVVNCFAVVSASTDTEITANYQVTWKTGLTPAEKEAKATQQSAGTRLGVSGVIAGIVLAGWMV
jgi:hypothetical protein